MKIITIIFLITVLAVQSFGQEKIDSVSLDQIQDLALAVQGSNLTMEAHYMFNKDGSKADFNFDKGERCLIGIQDNGLIQVYLEEPFMGAWGAVTTRTQVTDISYEFTKHENEDVVKINFKNSDRESYTSNMIWVFDTTARNIDELITDMRSSSSRLRGITVSTRLDRAANPDFTHAIAICAQKTYTGA